jgi:hypothetical protein
LVMWLLFMLILFWVSRRPHKNMRTHHEKTKTGKHEKGTGFFIAPSSFVLS